MCETLRSMGGAAKATRSGTAILVAVAALVAAVAGTAIADDQGASTAVSKKKVKKIAKKQINKLAPGLSVAHARTADSATSAKTANRATAADRATRADTATIGGPVAFGLVDCSSGADCEVVAAESRRLTDGMVAIGFENVACFDVPFSFRGAQATVELGTGELDAVYARGDPSSLCGPGFDATAAVFAPGSTAPTNSSFHIAFYR
jgi:hypothetical protein